jgi:hypothetical protein
MGQERPYQRGDVVRHASRPEWGDGVVDRVTTITHEGRSVQRLVIRFANRGRVTVNTAVAPLVAKGLSQKSFDTKDDETSTMSRTQTRPSFDSTTSSNQGGWLGSLASRATDQDNELWRLGDAMTDPFASLIKRLEDTLETFKYTTEPRSLMDWACEQTGLSDPMSKYTRHELELGFERFTVERERHLRNLLKQLKARNELEEAKEVRRWLKLPGAVSALDKAMNQL